MTLLLAMALAATPALALEIPHEEYQLDNGLNVILHPDPSLPQVVINLWYGVGSKDEVSGRSGFAHMFEHLMFMGTTRLPGSGFDDQMEAHGGWNNAWTSEDATDYYSVGPSTLAPTLLWMEADRLDGLGAAMTQEKLDLQREVVRNERRQSSEDTPYGVAWLELNAAMYPPEHPYAHTVIGSHEDLQAATLGDVVSFFETWYVPNNASLVVAGDFNPAEMKPEIERMFAGLERRELPTRADVAPVDLPTKPITELTDQVQVPQTAMIWHTPKALQAGDAHYDLVASILGDGRTSRLYQRLVHEDQIALEIDAYQFSQKLGSIFMVMAKPTDGHTMEEIEAAVAEEIARLAEEGPTEAEMERVKIQVEVAFLRSLESLHARASALNRYRYLAGTPDYLAADLQRYRDTTPDQIKAAAALLNTERRALLRVRPEAPATGEAQ